MTIGLGVDSVDVERFRQVLERRPTLLTKLFTEEERRVADGHVDPAPRLAARFAAKEAAMKALGVGLGAFGFHDVATARLHSGAPTLIVGGGAATLAVEQGVRVWRVSLTHTATTATAVVITE